MLIAEHTCSALMQPLLMLALWIVVAILVVWGMSLLLSALKLGDPWRTVLLLLVVLGVVFLFAREFGGW